MVPWLSGVLRAWNKLFSSKLQTKPAPVLHSHLCQLQVSLILASKGQEDRVRTSLPENMVAGYSDGTIRVFDVTNAQMVRKMHPHGAPVKALSYSFDGEK